jgi:hypothetical protein
MAKYAGEYIDRDDPCLPDVLRELGTSYVSVSKDIVRVELHGGFDHYGVLAFPEGVEGHGDRKLMEGLWYYTEVAVHEIRTLVVATWTHQRWSNGI